MNRERFLKNGILSATLLALIALTGCQEMSFPDPNNPNLDDAAVQALITGIEAGMRANLGTYTVAVSVIGREAYNFDPADPAWTDEVLYGPLDPGGFIVENPWGARYRVIGNCNNLLEKSSDAGVQGFANTVIAYQLMLALNMLHDNGVKLDYSGVLDNFASRAEAQAEIARLLDAGNTSLGQAGSSFSFSLSPGFAGFDTPATFARFNRALRARAAVYAGDFTAALTALNGSFLDAGGDLTTGVYHVFGSGLGDQLNPIFEAATADFVKFRAHPSFLADAEAGDSRVTAKTLDRTGDAVFLPEFGTTELASAFPITIVPGAAGPFPIIRNEELILLRAEANVGNGDYAAAEADLNIVRAAAGLAGYSGTDASNGLDRVLNEKRYSLFCEGHRWVDMRRYGRIGNLPIDRTGDAVRPDDIIHVQYPRPQAEVSGG